MIDELHNAKGSVDLSKLENMLNDTIENETTDSVHEWYNERKSAIINQVIILPQEEIEKHFAMCDFDDTCNVCDDPQGWVKYVATDENGCIYAYNAKPDKHKHEWVHGVDGDTLKELTI